MKVELVRFDLQQVRHVENFIKHCALGTYNNNMILRYIPEFILQTGDPDNTGKTSSASDLHTFDIDSHFPVVEKPPIKRGTLFMVHNNGNEQGLGSQFFIALSDKHKDALNSVDYTLIGQVIDGYSTLEEIENDDELNDPGKIKKNGKVRGKWKKQPWINHIEIHYNPFAC